MVQLEDDIDTYNNLNPGAAKNRGKDKVELENRRQELRRDKIDAVASPYLKRGYIRIEADGPNKLHLVNPIGSLSSRKLLAYWQSSAGKQVMETLRELDINPISSCYVEDRGAAEYGPLQGKTFVLTGSLSIPRDEMERLITAAGGKATGSVTKKTHYLVAGEGGGSKREKALSLGIPIIDETTLRNMMEDDSPTP